MKTCSKCGVVKSLEDFYKNRHVKSGYQSRCKDCTKAAAVDHWEKKLEEDPEWANQKRRDYYARNKETEHERSRKWQRENKAKHYEYTKAWQSKNRDIMRANTAKWQAENPDKVRELSARYRAKKLQATPEWLTQENLDQIKDIYAHARDCEVVTGDKYHVDHIVPLRGENVSGLHVPWNLQVLPAEVNIAKSNKTCHLSTV